MQKNDSSITVGRYLGKRLKELGVKRFFTVPGDYTMSLLDELLAEDLQGFGCCNEMNAGYAVDGYTRLSGTMGVLVVTYMVGALSALNAVAGAAAADLPLLVIVGGPNSHAASERRMVHHSIDTDLDRCARCFEPIVSDCFKVINVHEAQNKVDEAIFNCMSKKKPVYLELACNVTMEHCSAPTPITNLVDVIRPTSDEFSLSGAVEAICRQVQHASKVVVVVGSKIRGIQEIHAVQELVQKLSCPVVTMPDAKGIYPETNNEFLGCYWGDISSPGVQQLVEQQADVLLFIGPVFSDYTTVGWSAQYPVHKKIVINTDNVHVHMDAKRFSFVYLVDVLRRLIEVVPTKDMQVLKQCQDSYREACDTAENGQQTSPGKAFQQQIHGMHAKQTWSKSQFMMHESLSIATLQKMLPEAINSTNTSVIVAETGDSWFIAQNFKLPSPQISFQIQMQYGSIGWALAALVGMGLFCQEQHLGRIVAFIGDGSFQVSAQELSTLVAQDINATIILLNNCSYSIENQIHPGPYNDLQCWDYVKLLDSVAGKHAKKHHAVGMHVHTNEDFQKGLRMANEHHGVFLMDCHISKNDCTAELHRWGHKVAEATMKM